MKEARGQDTSSTLPSQVLPYGAALCLCMSMSFILCFLPWAMIYHPSSIILHCTVFCMLPMQSAPLQGFILLWLCKPQNHCLFPTSQYVSLCNLALLELLYSMQKKIIYLLRVSLHKTLQIQIMSSRLNKR